MEGTQNTECNAKCSGTDKVRNPGLGPDPDHSAKNGQEKVQNWAQGPEFFWDAPGLPE